MADESVPKTDRELQQEKAELLLGNLLRVGIGVSFLITIGGILMIFVHHPDYLSNPNELPRLMHYGAEFPTTLHEVAHGLAAKEGRAVVALGVLLLILTPVARVVASAIIFAIEKDRVYALLTCAVLMVLLISFVSGKAG